MHADNVLEEAGLVAKELRGQTAVAHFIHQQECGVDTDLDGEIAEQKLIKKPIKNVNKIIHTVSGELLPVKTTMRIRLLTISLWTKLSTIIVLTHAELLIRVVVLLVVLLLYKAVTPLPSDFLLDQSFYKQGHEYTLSASWQHS